MTTRYLEAVEAPIGDVIISSLNVRKDVGDISELTDSIREKGILEPLIARRGGSGKYEVIIGSRRLAAARQVGLSTVPLIVREISDADSIIQGLIENLQRGDLSLEDRVEAYKRLQKVDSAYTVVRALARAIGLRQLKVVQDFEAYEALTRLRPHGIGVITQLSPSAAERQAGEAIPERHATLLQQAATAVRGSVPDSVLDQKYPELAKAIAPYDQEDAKRILDQFKMYPERPVSEIVSMATANVEREITLPAPTARRLEELKDRLGARNWDEAITTLVEQAAPEPSFSQTPLPLEAPTREETPEVAQPRRESLELPEEPMSVQLANKAIWNVSRLPEKPSFYTCGYTGRDIQQFIDILNAAGVKTVVDVRHTPVSMYKPEFSKENLAHALGDKRLNYIHAPDLGVPRNVRAEAVGRADRKNIWDWYDRNVAAKVKRGFLEEIEGRFEAPVAFLCVELDPTACHRHRLALALEEFGLHGYDL